MAKPLIEINGKDYTLPALFVLAILVGFGVMSFIGGEPEVQIKQPIKTRKAQKLPAKKSEEKIKTVGEISRAPATKPVGTPKKRAKPKNLKLEQLKPSKSEKGRSHASKQITEGVNPEDAYEIISLEEASIEQPPLEESTDDIITY